MHYTIFQHALDCLTALFSTPEKARKVVSRIFRNLLIRQIGTRYPTVNHIAENKEIIFYLLEGYDHKDGKF